MNRFTIYQVRNDDAEIFRTYSFRALDSLVRKGLARAAEGVGPYRLPRDAWQPVYTWHTEKEPDLEYIFETFNRNGTGHGIAYERTPEDFTGRSMSVSDIVEYPDGRLWYCDILGWKEIVWQSN